MNSSDITLTIFILWVFTMLHSFSKLSLEMNNIKQNWSDYRCKPSIMLFANVFGHDTFDNFNYCIQNIQSSFMGNYTGPIKDRHDQATNSMGSGGLAMGNTTSMTSTMRSNQSSGATGTFSIFGNAGVEFQRAAGTVKDTIKKMSAAVTSQGHAMNAGASGGKGGMKNLMDTIKKV